jgi:predicted metal-dependent hydrolase
VDAAFSRPADQPPVEIRASRRRRKTVAAFWEGDTIVVAVPHWMPEHDRLAFVDQLVPKLVAERERCRPTDAALTERAIALSQRYLGGRALPTAVTWTSRQHMRWGSCTPANGTIRISDRLAGVPGWVLDAVLVHELAHLLHADHGAEFHEVANRHPRAADSDVFLAGYSLGLRRAEDGSG